VARSLVPADPGLLDRWLRRRTGQQVPRPDRRTARCQHVRRAALVARSHKQLGRSTVAPRPVCANGAAYPSIRSPAAPALLYPSHGCRSIRVLRATRCWPCIIHSPISSIHSAPRPLSFSCPSLSRTARHTTNTQAHTDLEGYIRRLRRCCFFFTYKHLVAQTSAFNDRI